MLSTPILNSSGLSISGATANNNAAGSGSTVLLAAGSNLSGIVVYHAMLLAQCFAINSSCRMLLGHSSSNKYFHSSWAQTNAAIASCFTPAQLMAPFFVPAGQALELAVAIAGTAGTAYNVNWQVL